MSFAWPKGSPRARAAGQLGGLTTWTRDPAAAHEQLAAARRAFEARFANERERRHFYARLREQAHQGRKRAQTSPPIAQGAEEKTES